VRQAGRQRKAQRDGRESLETGKAADLTRHCQATMGLYEGETPLYFMISHGNVKMVEWLRDRNVRCERIRG
jgi:hypothetical protein